MSTSALTDPTADTAETELFDEVAICYDGTLEGLLSAIFTAYEQHVEPSDVAPEHVLQPRLSQHVICIETDMSKAERVRVGLIKRCGSAAFDAVKKVSLSSDPSAGNAAYRFVRYAMDKNKNALNDIAHPAVEPLFRINRAVSNECEKMRQFIRFEHLRDDTADFWFARCNPRDSVVPLIIGHFIERFNMQPFIIYDENHRIAGVYDGRTTYLVRTDDEAVPELVLPPRAREEALTQTAWKNFYHAVSIEARYNPELRRRFMPRRLWRNITEMQEEIGKEIRTDSADPNERMTI